MITKMNLPGNQVIKWDAFKNVAIVDYTILDRLQNIEKFTSSGEKWKIFAYFADNESERSGDFTEVNEKLGKVGIDENEKIKNLNSSPITGIFIK